MLDSSPVALPSIPRPLKRSASTASLPTPPRTHRRYARGRSRGSCDSDSDENVALSSDEEEEESRNKKRRMGEKTTAADANEEAFWLGDSDAGVASSSSTTKNDTSSKAPLLYRRLQAQAQMDVAPVSPPPSHRKAAMVTPQRDVAVSPPSTPRTRSATKRALFDSPNNPFVGTPQKVADDSDTASPSASSANPSPRTPKASEKPTITYVLRVYQNPLFNHAENRPFSPPPASKLPLDHPDYSPALNCAPKLLFPEARRGKGRGKKPAGAAPAARGKKRARSPSVVGDDADEEIRPIKLNFGGPDKKAKVNNTKTLDLELKSAGETLTL
ncbi:hypothetical protein M413DRAFT_448069 [Hebeloma cylindrosporum]|uniref:Uncharacterized protein n=1 Tax=Hebeloma cylindrosporum TaxID=76867 RepID=A0A0C2YAH9_HEBCY|nr:hypothetical protein M413DRAFT_448069 [Hebeloma cylindrosporum h7]